MAPVVFDSTYLIDLFNPKLKGDKRAALDTLIAEFSRTKTSILIPAPSLTEMLIHADKARDEYVQKLNGNTAFAVIPFDRRAATECSFLLADAWDKKVQKGVTRTKFKFDWMIVACAASRNIKLIYSDDADIARCAEQRDIKVIMQNTLKVPEESRQGRIPGVD